MSMGTGSNGDNLDLRVLVCDDESVAREYLKLVLGRINGVKVMGEAANAAECLQRTGELQPDVVFLDINLPDSSGMEVAEALSGLSEAPRIVFVTGYEDYAVHAFELAAVDYVMKPYDQSRIERTIRRIASGQSQRHDPQSEPLHNGFWRLPIRERDSVKLVDPKDICFVRTQGRKTCVRTTSSVFLTPYTLGELEKRLEMEGFFRANEGCLVNLECVKEVVYYGPRTYELLLNDPDETLVPLSRSRAQRLKEMLNL